MERYLNLGGSSGVASFEIGTDFIWVRFRDGSRYLYDNVTPGSPRLEQMQHLAVAGRGLNAYIKTQVDKDYVRKIR